MAAAQNGRSPASSGTGSPRRTWFIVLWRLAAIPAAAGIFVVVLQFAYVMRFPWRFDMAGVPDGVANGFYPAETNGELTWAWTGATAGIALAGLDRNVAWHWTGVPLVWRPPGAAPPEVTISADGVVVHRQTVRADREIVEVVIPPRVGASGLQLTIDAAPAFVPSPGDARALGIAVESMTLRAEPDSPMVPRAALLNGLAGVVLITLGLVVLRLPAAVLTVVVTLAAVGQAWVMASGFAVHLDYPARVPVLATSLTVGSVAAVWLTGRLRGTALDTAARCAAGVSVLACYLKLLILLHPSMPVGDGLFHAHRFEQVLRGELYFTSLAPGSIAFPYPVLLYVAAAPFSLLTDATVDRLALLRIVVTVADAAAALLVYWLVVRTLADARIALASVVWYHLMPVTAWIMTWGNLTNAFAQAWFVAALALIAALPIDWRRPRTVIAVAVVAAAAQLSHPSASAILLLTMGATAVLYRRYGGDPLGGAARGVWAAALAATAAAVLLYYAWFPAIYVSELDRVAAVVAERATDEASTLGHRFEALGTATIRFFAWPAIVAALVGLCRLRVPMAPGRLTLLLAGLAAACLFFVGLGLVTPISLRTHLAAVPAVAVLAAVGSTWALRSHWILKASAAAMLLAACRAGVEIWLRLLE